MSKQRNSWSLTCPVITHMHFLHCVRYRQYCCHPFQTPAWLADCLSEEGTMCPTSCFIIYYILMWDCSGHVCIVLMFCSDNIYYASQCFWNLGHHRHHHHHPFFPPILNICIQYIMSGRRANMSNQYSHWNCTRQGHLGRLGLKLRDGCHLHTRTSGMWNVLSTLCKWLCSWECFIDSIHITYFTRQHDIHPTSHIWLYLRGRDLLLSPLVHHVSTQLLVFVSFEGPSFIHSMYPFSIVHIWYLSHYLYSYTEQK